jgi:hypothetical protein
VSEYLTLPENVPSGFPEMAKKILVRQHGKPSTTNADYDWFEYAKNEAPRGQGGRGIRGF